MNAIEEQQEGHRISCALVVDDDDLSRELLRFHLHKNGYEVLLAPDAPAAMAIIAVKHPDIILLDIMMPGISGLELLRTLKNKPETATTPIILISGLRETEDVVKGLELGANDYIVKPLNVKILIARMETHLRMRRMIVDLERKTLILAQLAAFDQLTGLYNRHSLMELLTTEASRTHRYKRNLSLMMMDLDHFKNVNDRYGHPTGDDILREFAQRANLLLRGNDILCRFGGEEFCVIMPETDTASAAVAAERIRSAMETEPIPTRSGDISITVSIGVATMGPASGQTVEELIETADQALYEAKNSGRNRIVCYKQK